MDWQIDIIAYLGPRRADRCLLLTEAAITLFATQGLGKTRPNDVCVLAGVSRSQFYHFFEDISDCFSTAHRICLAELELRITRATNEKQSWQEQLRHGIAAAIDLISENPNLGRLALLEGQLAGSEADRQARQASIDKLTSALTHIFECAAPPEVQVTPLVARMAIGSARQALILALENPEPDAFDQASTDVAVAILTASFGPLEARRLAEVLTGT